MSDSEDNQELSSKLRVVPLNREACETLIQTLTEEGVRVEVLNEQVLLDPVITLEVLRIANGLKNIAGGKLVLSTKAALLALGLSRVREISRDLLDNCPRFNEDEEFWIKVIKQKAKQTGVVAGIIAGYVDPKFIPESHSLGLMSSFGDLIAIKQVGKGFIMMLEEGLRRSKVKYRLSQQFRFQVDLEGVEYLKQSAVPAVVTNVLDLDNTNLSPDENRYRAICFSAIEFVEAHLEERFERLSPEHSIPPKSFRRMLQLPEDRYKALYEEIKIFLEQGEVHLEEKMQDNLGDQMLTGEEEVLPGEAAAPVEEALQPEGEGGEDAEQPSSEFDVDLDDDGPPIITSGASEQVEELVPPPDDGPEISKSERMLPEFIDMFEQVQTLDVLIPRLLEMLIEEGPFLRSAILVISPDEGKAVPVIMRGASLEETRDVNLSDPLSPLSKFQSQVVSYSRKDSGVSPFGSPIYALSPLDVNHPHPVALYADCGDEPVLGFEARRLFRKVVNILNSLLPQMGGSIPIEKKDPPSSE